MRVRRDLNLAVLPKAWDALELEHAQIPRAGPEQQKEVPFYPSLLAHLELRARVAVVRSYPVEPDFERDAVCCGNSRYGPFPMILPLYLLMKVYRGSRDG